VFVGESKHGGRQAAILRLTAAASVTLRPATAAHGVICSLATDSRAGLVGEMMAAHNYLAVRRSTNA
jgi:tagatose-1,6-bisphosphate aldolase